MACCTPAINASPEAAPKEPPINLKSCAPAVTSILLSFPFAIETASSCLVKSLAFLSRSEYFLLSTNFKGSSLGSGASIISKST